MFRWVEKIRQASSRAQGAVELAPDGFVHYSYRQSHAWSWLEVTRVEVHRLPNQVVENFGIKLSSDTGRSVVVWDKDAGFSVFRDAMITQWPEIEKSWTAVYCGSPDVEEHATLWQRRESY
jgi:hypothetical protein